MINTRDLFKYRNVWMGIAILLVVFFHTEMVFRNPVLRAVQEYGYGGVDIFIFASGIGCYYSLHANANPAEFIKRRVVKIMPTYLCFMIVWLIYKKTFFEMSITSMIGNLFCVQNFTYKGNEFNWYVSAMWLMYLLAPFLTALADRLDNWKKILATMALLLLFTVSFWYSYTYIITIVRIPIFFLGILVAKKASEGLLLKRLHVWLLSLASGAGMVLLVLLNRWIPDKIWLVGGLWYPFIAIVPGLCLLISLACARLEAVRGGRMLVGLLTGLGKRTFEVYLIHIFVFDIFYNILLQKGLCSGNNLNWFLLVVPIGAGCVLLVLAVKGMKGLYKKLENRGKASKEAAALAER